MGDAHVEVIAPISARPLRLCRCTCSFGIFTLRANMAIVPATYRAYVYERFGPVEEILKLVDVSTEPLPASHVRIQIHSAALNPIDFKLPEIYRATPAGDPSTENPYRIGFDVAGVVVEASADVNDFQVGDNVYAMAGRGSLAEYITVDVQRVAHTPKVFALDQAAGVPLASLTSFQALNDHGNLREGERVLVLGGSSATGIFAVQYAKAVGAHVTATTSTKNVALVQSLGADVVVDYTTQSWGQVLDAHSIDLIYDCGVEPQSWEADAQLVLKQDTGRFVTLKRGLSPSAAKYGATYKEVLTNSSGRDLKQITQLIDDGRIKPIVDSIFTLEQAKEAFSRLKTGHAVGKIIVRVA